MKGLYSMCLNLYILAFFNLVSHCWYMLNLVDELAKNLEKKKSHEFLANSFLDTFGERIRKISLSDDFFFSFEFLLWQFKSLKMKTELKV